MRTWAFAAIAALMLAGCAYKNPTSPTPPPSTTPTIGPPASVTVTAISGAGTSAILTVHVLDANGHGVPNARVQLTTTVGVVDPDTPTTNSTGTATASLFSNQKSTVSASLGELHSAEIDVDGRSRFSVALSGGSGGTRGESYRFTVSVTPFVKDMQFAAGSVTFGDGGSAPMNVSAEAPVAVFAHTYFQPGSFAIAASVTDSLGITEQTTTHVTISNPPAPPPPAPPPAPTYAVTVSASPTAIIVGDTSTLTATATAQNGAPAVTSYEWDCDGNGTVDFTTAGPSQVCTYNTAGTISSRVTAKGAGASGTGSASVTVGAAAPLFVSIAASSLTPAIGDTVTYTATVSSTRSLPATFDFYWDETNDGTYDHVRVGQPNPSTQAVIIGPPTGNQTVKVRVVDPVSAREATSTRTVTVH